MSRFVLLPFRLIAWLFNAAGWLLLVFGLFSVAALLVLRTMPGSSYEGRLPALDSTQRQLSERLRAHVVGVASAEHNVPRAYEELEKSARYIEEVLRQMNLQPREQVFEAAGRKVRNIEVHLPALDNSSGRVLVLGAHYDSGLGSPGANDNGTGVAALLELAREFSAAPTRRGASDLLLVFYVNEEPPFFRTSLMGSRVHARELVSRGVPVVGMLSLETLGAYYDTPGSQHYPPLVKSFFPDVGNFVGFVGTVPSWSFVRKAVGAFRERTPFPSQGLAAPRQVPGIDWSDHQAYAEAGIPAAMVTDTAIYRYAAYHTAQDTPEQVDFDKLARVTQGLAHVVRTLSEDRAEH